MPEPRLFSVQQRKKAASAEDLTFTVLPCHIKPAAPAPDADGAAGEGAASTIRLGELDALFANEGRHPTYVELLVLPKCALDPARLSAALRQALGPFLGVCGRRKGKEICAGPGVRFSAIQIETKQLLSTPPALCLFDVPTDGNIRDGASMLTVRLASCARGDLSGIGVCFDHALCDISGIGLLLAHISACYVGPSVDVSIPAPSHARHQQAEVVREEESTDAVDVDTARSKVERTKGGVVCVEWYYTATQLTDMKGMYEAYSRHDAIYADVVLLLGSVGGQGSEALASATLSRCDRARAGLSMEHFGNAIVVVEAALPPLPSSSADVAAALRSAICEGKGISLTRAPAGVHLNTWWHPLQRPMAFGATAAPSFAVGPGSLASAAQMCALRGGQPNVTLLPAEEGGIVVDLLVPLSVGHDVLKLLRARSKEARTLANLKYLKEAPSELRAESPQQCRGAAEEEDPLTLPVNADINVARPVANPDDPGQGRAVVWFHGLGDTSLSWVKRLASVLPHIGGVANFHQPVAPLRHDPITTTSAPSDHATASWFDLKALPVTADSEPAEAPKGLEDAIKVAHTTIDTLVKQGIPAQSILLGGFSQGAAVAIAAGISYPQHLAGIVSISGWWCTCREDLASKVHGSNSTIPMWFSYGTADDTVDSKLSSVSAELLGSALQEGSVQVTKVQRKKHSPNNVELKAACTWMVEHLTPSGGTEAEKAMPKPEVAAAEASQARDTTRSAPALQGCWTCSGTSNDEMVGKLEAAGIISAPSLKAAMLATDRALYVPHEETTSEPGSMATTQTSNAGKIRNKKASSSYSYGPYADAPQAIGWKATISAPHTHGKALDLLAGHLSRPGCRVLDVGCGSGMLVALMARMALYSSTHGDDGNPTEFDGNTLPRAVIVGIDRVPGLVGLGTRNLARDGFDVETSASSEAGFASPPSTPLLVVRHGDGWEGAKDIGPFDAIHVGASPPVIPEALLQQLKPGGRMIVPVGEPRVIKERGGSTMQEWTQVDRHISGCSGGGGPTTADEFAFEVISTVRFVPLVAPSF